MNQTNENQPKDNQEPENKEKNSFIKQAMMVTLGTVAGAVEKVGSVVSDFAKKENVERIAQKGEETVDSIKEISSGVYEKLKAISASAYEKVKHAIAQNNEAMTEVRVNRSAEEAYRAIEHLSATLDAYKEVPGVQEKLAGLDEAFEAHKGQLLQDILDICIVFELNDEPVVQECAAPEASPTKTEESAEEKEAEREEVREVSEEDTQAESKDSL